MKPVVPLVGDMLMHSGYNCPLLLYIAALIQRSVIYRYSLIIDLFIACNMTFDHVAEFPLLMKELLLCFTEVMRHIRAFTCTGYVKTVRLVVQSADLFFVCDLNRSDVFFILVKWGFPAITGMVDERNEYIDKSLQAAKEANERLAGIQTECDELLKETRAEKARILKEAADRRDEIIAEAENRAKESGEKLISDAREQIRLEKEEALRSLRRQVAELSVQVAERVVLKELSTDEDQLLLIDRMIDDVKTGK